MLKNEFNAVVIGTAALVAAGCATPPQPRPSAPVAEEPLKPIEFPTADHDAYLATGNNIVTGQAFLRQRGGGTVTCAGNEVLLVPDTRYFGASLLLGKLGVIPESDLLAHIPPGYEGVVHQGQCDAQGNFAFTNIPSGAWQVSTKVEWVVGYDKQGGRLRKSIAVADGTAAPVFLTDPDLL